MKKDSRLSSALHLLLHMAHSDRPLTSGALATMLDTDPAVVRRGLAGLRELGYVASVKGHGGGWSVTCDLRKVTLRDVYDAVGSPEVFAMQHRTEQPSCLVEQAINHALDEAFEQAHALLISRLERVTLAELSADFGRRMARHRQRNHRHAH